MRFFSAMFSLQPDTIARVALCGSLGAAAGLAVHELVRRRRLRKLGFTADDLSSREKALAKWAEIAVQQIPEKISLTQIESHVWSKPSEHAAARTALEKLGLERNPIFVASPQKWVVEFWLSKEAGLFGAILDAPPCGLHTEIVVSHADGSTVSFENTEDCGRKHLETHNWIHCGLVAPDQLLDKARRERRDGHVEQMRLADCVQSYERAINVSLAWRRRVGFTTEEMKYTFEQQRRKRSLLRRLL
jgi:hypothetical protein